MRASYVTGIASVMMWIGGYGGYTMGFDKGQATLPPPPETPPQYVEVHAPTPPCPPRTASVTTGAIPCPAPPTCPQVATVPCPTCPALPPRRHGTFESDTVDLVSVHSTSVDGDPWVFVELHNMSATDAVECEIKATLMDAEGHRLAEGREWVTLAASAHNMARITPLLDAEYRKNPKDLDDTVAAIVRCRDAVNGPDLATGELSAEAPENERRNDFGLTFVVPLTNNADYVIYNCMLEVVLWRGSDIVGVAGGHLLKPLQPKTSTNVAVVWFDSAVKFDRTTVATSGCRPQ